MNEIWVYPRGSDTVYQGTFPEDLKEKLEKYSPTYNEQGLLETLTFPRSDGQMMTVECITMQTLNLRAGIWVCPKGSNTIYQGPFPEHWKTRLEEFFPTFNNNGFLDTLTFLNGSGLKVTIECITKQTLFQRATVCISPKGSSTIYQGSFPEDWQTQLTKYQPTYTRKGLLATLTFINEDRQPVTIEFVNKHLLNNRITVWVCPKGSNIIYQGLFPEDWETHINEYRPTYNKNGLLKTLTFSDPNGQTVTVERVTQHRLSHRASIWVWPKSSNTIYQGPFPEDWQTRIEEYQPTYDKNDLLETLTFPATNEQTVTIECITKAILNQRAAGIWVYPKGSDSIYKGFIPEDWQTRTDKYQPTYKKGILKTLTFPLASKQMVTIECISKQTLNQRAPVWVCPKGSSIVYKGLIPHNWQTWPTEYQATYNGKSLIKTLTFDDENGQAVTIECITQNTLKKRIVANNSNKAQSSRKRKAEHLVYPQNKKQKLTLECESELTEHHIELPQTPPAATPVVNLPTWQTNKFHFFTSNHNNTNAQQNSFEEEFWQAPDDYYSFSS
ncbi:MAG TPA: hypothetical protein PK657_00065 [Legionella sp.]|nr:hypothetical protein [Legionella sp.]